MEGRICLVTGATAGIGQAAAVALARRGATVVIVGRDRAKAEAGVASIRMASGHHRIEAMLADLSSQASIRELAASFQSRYGQLHILVNSAAIYTRTRTLTVDGLELMFATNHLGYFLLTRLLLDKLKNSAPASIINVTAPSTSKLNFDDLHGQQSFSSLSAFGASKMGNLLFTFALARRLEGTGVIVNAFHPGVVRTGLMKEVRGPMRLFIGLLNRFAPEPAAAGESLAALAAANAHNRSGQLLRGAKPIQVGAYALDETVQERLWAVSSQLVGLPI